MFATTLTLTINAVARTLTRVSNDNGSTYLYRDAVEEISMRIRHNTENKGGFPTYSHNIFVEQTVFATPTVAEKYFSTSITMKDRRGSGPADLLKLWQGVNTLALTLDDTLVTGDN